MYDKLAFSQWERDEKRERLFIHKLSNKITQLHCLEYSLTEITTNFNHTNFRQ